MPNRLTAVPPGDVPALSRGLTPLVLAADAFMGLMLSRPGGLSLRQSWVTPATLLLAGAVGAGGLGLAVVLAVRGGWQLVVAAVLVVLAALAGSVVVVGVAQRLSRQP